MLVQQSFNISEVNAVFVAVIGNTMKTEWQQEFSNQNS
jgi:hypothetical protein